MTAQEMAAIAQDFEKWQEAADPCGLMTETEYEALSTAEAIQMVADGLKAEEQIMAKAQILIAQHRATMMSEEQIAQHIASDKAAGLFNYSY